MDDIVLTVLVLNAVLISIRVGAALRLIPFFGGHPMPVLPWLGLSFSLGLILSFQTGHGIGQDLNGLRFAALVTKEIFVGIVIGALVRFSFSVLEVVGEVAHLSSLSVLAGQGQSPYTTAYLLLGAGVFFLMKGHHALISGLASTIACVPPLEIPGIASVAGAGQDAAIRLFSSAMAAAVLISAPIFAAGLFAEVIVGMVSRLNPGWATGGAQTLRVAAVQVTVLASLCFVVTSAIELLEAGLADLSLCAPR
jgi:flagellar biosynthetic protein FliR